VRHGTVEGAGVKIFRRILLDGAVPVLFVATTTLWTLSYRIGVGLNWSSAESTTRVRFETIRSSRGQLAYAMEDHGYTFLIGPPHEDGWMKFEPTTDYRRKTYAWSLETEGVGEFAGFGFRSWDRFVRVLIIPYWAIVLPSGTFVVLRSLRGIRRMWELRRRSRLGRCRSCGYDLRASPDRCPECGVIAARVSH
jgi:hypothetical protein